MNIVSLLLAGVAFVLFLCAGFNTPSRHNLVALGLAFLTAAWVAASIWAEHLVHIH